MTRFPLLLVVPIALFVVAGCDSSSSPPAGTDAGGGGTDAGGGGGTDAGGGGGTDAGPGELDAGMTADTWDSWAMGFFATYCADCHHTSPKDFTMITDVHTFQAEIRCGVTDVALTGCGSFPPPRQFPIGTGPHPTDPERARLVAWIDSGAP